MLVGLSPKVAAHLAAPVQSAAPQAEVLNQEPKDLRPSEFTAGTLLILQDGGTQTDGVTIIRRLRRRGFSTPVILVVTGDDFACPVDLDRLGDLDVLPLAEISRFAMRRSLALLNTRIERETLIEEVGGQLRAYQRRLASKEEERHRVHQVATALERRLSSAENDFQRAEAELVEKVARADAYTTQLEQRIAELEATGNPQARTKASEEARQRRQQAQELRLRRDQSLHQDQALAELRQTCSEQERKLQLLTAERVQARDLATRLQASEQVRVSQNETLQVYQRRIQEIEQNLASMAALLEAEAADPTFLLKELAARLTQFETARSEQQHIIDRLSRSLTEQQIDDAFDQRPPRVDAVSRVDEAMRLGRRLRTPLSCVMIGLDDAMPLRSDLGSLLYDYLQIQLAERLQLSLRQGDVVMRYEDGTFILITEARTAADRLSHAERLIREVCQEPLEVGGRLLEIGISIAILALDQEQATTEAQDLLRRAQGTLLQAQARGQRQILVGAGNSSSMIPPGSEGPPQRALAS